MDASAYKNDLNHCYLSRQLLSLLSYGGVPNEIFMASLRSNLDELNVVYSNKTATLKGNILVYKKSGLDFCDIKVMQAIFVENLHCYVGDGDNALFLPHEGSSSMPDDIAKGDIAPEVYWISKNRRTINAIQMIADSWMALMDRLLTLRDLCKQMEMDIVKRNMLTLVDIYNEALHANKIRRKKIQMPKELIVDMFPHYMERDTSYTFTSILGLISDTVNNLDDEDISNIEITKLCHFMVHLPVGYMDMWKALHEQYKDEIATAFDTNYNRKHEAAKVIQVYKELKHKKSKNVDLHGKLEVKLLCGFTPFNKVMRRHLVQLEVSDMLA
ncbi:RNA-dependent RNA polymerase, eukaryotic-type [Sesbania bispinosa]|nr:RNA-dependent RNA polymerase, eukaryotic-type [Sesbania bispinosa]